MHSLSLQSVDSLYASADQLRNLQLTVGVWPTDLPLMDHQARTLQALRDPGNAVVLNTAMTGDGKSLAGQLPLLLDRRFTFTLYPTNELARDQWHALSALQARYPRWKALSALDADQIDAARLDELQLHAQDLSRSEALIRLLYREYVLANPDILHHLMQLAYQNRGSAVDTLLGQVAQRFKTFVYDEFHLFGIDQMAAVLIHLLLLRQISPSQHSPRHLFLSATPPHGLEALLERLGLRAARIEGSYQHGLDRTPDGHRRILQPVDLHLHAATLEDWLHHHAENVLLPFFAEQGPAARGVLVANSAASAHRAYALLKMICPPHLRLGINAGITPKEVRAADFDLLIATSTADVGDDFRINFLVFESMDAASHLQRLGRLGRHLNDGQGHRFQTYQAHALLPSWVSEQLALRFPLGASISRQDYSEAIQEAFPTAQSFIPYLKRWAGLQAGHVLRMLSKPEISTQYAPYRGTLQKQYQALFGRSVGRYMDLWESKPRPTAVLDAAASFRPSEALTALIQHDSGHTLVPYSLIALLRHAEVEVLDMERAYQQAERLGQGRASLERHQPLAAYRLLAWLPKARPLSLFWDGVLADLTDAEQVVEHSGFSLNVQGVPELYNLNCQLIERKLATFFIPHKTPDEVRRQHCLGFRMMLLEFQSSDQVTGCLALGRDALLLDAVYQQRRATDAAPIIY